MFINWKLREINLKIVYYGPALSGKTTNLEYIHAHTNPKIRGELVSIKTHEDRTLFFDFLQLELGEVMGLKPKFHLYTVPGQVYYVASRKLVLQGADGVVFVADSQIDRLDDNVESLRDMKVYLAEMGYKVDDFPLVIQLNKRDLPNAAPVPLLRSTLAANGRPCFEAVATEGKGVFDTLKVIIQRVVGKVQSEI
ncbi:MAG TPA: gliding-motility protein MglA [Anaerolineae bacterium]|nr:gliding-motility protein MglA [Anaerolineae bacterium]